MSKRISMAEVAKHKESGNAWVIVEGHVFDVSAFVSVKSHMRMGHRAKLITSNQADDHPGGKKILLRNCGKDSTSQFQKFVTSSRATINADLDRFHNNKILKKYMKLKIGDVQEDAKL